MKRQLFILRAVLDESAKWLSINPTRDFETIESRFEKEGDSFISITLPAIHDHILECVKNGKWSPSRLLKEDSRGGPVFLREFLRLIFDKGTGTVLDTPEAVSALRCVRQILLLHSKVKALPSQKRMENAIDGFIQTERDLREARKSILSALDSTSFLEVSDILYRDIFSRVETMLFDDSVIFKHGPGATADGSFGARKYENISKTWTSRVEHVFPLSDFGFVNLHHYMDSCPSLDYAVKSPREETPMKVTLVPKTQKTPRIIAMESTVNQFIQQGLLELIDESIQASPLRDYISWRDQERNKFLARLGSSDLSLATLDLSEASDRVHVSVVSRMLRRHPLLRKAVFASRSTTASISGELIRLEKFAPMGSALCFAFETLAFFAMIVSSELSRKGIPVTDLSKGPNSIRSSLLKGLSAYGDDIIVPTAGAVEAADFLESFGLKVNRRKSFWTGEFRESCGGDFFRGVDVTVVRLREPIPSGFLDRKAIWSLTSFQNQLYKAGYFKAAEEIRKMFPYIPSSDQDLTSGIYFLSSLSDCKVRWNANLQRLEYKVFKGVFFTPHCKFEGWDELHHSLITLTRNKGLPSSHQVQPFDRRPELRSLRSSWIPANS